MYGLINRALERMVVDEHGRPAWDAIRREAGIEVEYFVTMQTYPDEITYDLVGAASRYFASPPEDLLHNFGRYWVRVVAPDGYGAMLTLAGGDLVQFLENLDLMHQRVAMAFTNLRQPSFQVENLGPGLLRLHYRSHRAGLGPFVIGLVEGLGERFATPVAVRWVERAGEGIDHDIFEIVHG